MPTGLLHFSDLTFGWILRYGLPVGPRARTDALPSPREELQASGRNSRRPHIGIEAVVACSRAGVTTADWISGCLADGPNACIAREDAWLAMSGRRGGLTRSAPAG